MIAHLKTQMLHMVGDGKIVLDEFDPRTHQHALKFRDAVEKLFHLVFSAESHHPLHSGAIIPTAIEQHDFATGRQVAHIALKIPLGFLTLAGRWQSLRQTRGFMRCVMRLMTPPLPAASRPSNNTTSLSLCSSTHSCSLISSPCRRNNSLKYRRRSMVSL